MKGAKKIMSYPPYKHGKTNVLMICVDHWSAELLHCAGHSVIRTPTLDQLAYNGIRFTNCYSECPVCIPARRTLMTGMSPRAQGDRYFDSRICMPDVKTMAQTFRDAGYQAYAVGKMHVFPQRDRIGFDDVILSEEARYQYGTVDDYQMWLAEQGFIGRDFEHGMCNNTYISRPWHLDEHFHNTNWATSEMCRMIKRRDPKRPGFFYLSYIYPHPPLVPLQCYLDMYNRLKVNKPYIGDWQEDEFFDQLTFMWDDYKDMMDEVRRAFYAQCTHIDNQLRRVFGTLREELMEEDTIIIFLSDHGDMLGNHKMFAKRVFYESSANVPLIISGAPLKRYNEVDDRLVCLADIMPTVLELCGIDVPDHVEGISALGEKKRDTLYGEVNIGVKEKPTKYSGRMVHDGRHKLIYYPVGNKLQLFDLKLDPNELKDVSEEESYKDIKEKLIKVLISNLYGGDEKLAVDGKLIGLKQEKFVKKPDYRFTEQRGHHWPPPPNKLKHNPN